LLSVTGRSTEDKEIHRFMIKMSSAELFTDGYRDYV
jgi:hypothetical protein